MRLLATLAVACLVSRGQTDMKPASESMFPILAELAKRRQAESVSAEAQVSAEALAAELRGFYYPKQCDWLRSEHKRKATSKTRRSGATTGGCREFMARALSLPRYRATYCNETRKEAKDLAWKSDTQGGFLDLLERYGKMRLVRGVTLYDIGGLVATVHKDELAIDFSNGSRIEMFCADDEGALERLRGRAKHVIWIDEAQKFRFLDSFYRSIVVGCLTDFANAERGGPLGGECWLSGTPGRDCAGMFYDVTKEADEHDQPLQGWEVHHMSVTDNPYFGATAEERWANTAQRALEENGWTEDDPDFQREWLARWVKGDSRYVYPVHAVPSHKLTFAPMRLDADGWYDVVKALADLPKKPNGRAYSWLFGIGVDFGYYPDPFAIVIWAYTPDLPFLFEMFSWKRVKVIADDQLAYLDAAYAAHDTVVALVGDPSGQGANLAGWRERGGLPIDDADKSGKWTWIELMGNDIRKGIIRYREGSPLLHEHRHLVLLPTKPGKPRQEHADRKLSDGTVPGDHCSDAGRYAYAQMFHHLHRTVAPKPKPGTAEADAAEEAKLETAHIAEDDGIRRGRDGRRYIVGDNDVEVPDGWGPDGYSW